MPSWSRTCSWMESFKFDHVQKNTTGPYPETAESTPRCPVPVRLIVLLFHLSQSSLFPSGFLMNSVCISCFLSVCYVPSNLILLDFITNNIWWLIDQRYIAQFTVFISWLKIYCMGGVQTHIDLICHLINSLICHKNISALSYFRECWLPESLQSGRFECIWKIVLLLL